MTVKHLTNTQKFTIAQLYTNKTLNQKQLAFSYRTSARTINRVLIEAGLLTPVAQLKADAYNVMQVLKKHGIDPSKLDQVMSFAENITTHKVQTFLMTLTAQQTSDLFYSTAMLKFEADSELAMANCSLVPIQETVTDDLPF